MKVYIGPYINYLGPYQIAEKLCFWAKKEVDEYGFKSTPEWVHNFGKKLSERADGTDTILTKVCQWINGHRKRTIKVEIHNYDAWSADSTLAIIILPILKKLKENKHGSPMVDIEDVPEHLQSVGHDDCSTQLSFEFNDDEKYKSESWDLMHQRWDWVLNEMIWAFEQLQPDNDWEQQYHSGISDIKFEPCTDNPNLSKMVRGPNDTHVFDAVGYANHTNRIDRGMKFFGKYYRGLWD